MDIAQDIQFLTTLSCGRCGGCVDCYCCESQYVECGGTLIRGVTPSENIIYGLMEGTMKRGVITISERKKYRVKLEEILYKYPTKEVK